MSKFTQKQSIVMIDKIIPEVSNNAKIMVEFPLGVYKLPFYPKGKGDKSKTRTGWKIDGKPVAARTAKIDEDGVAVKFNKEWFHIVGMHKVRGETLFTAIKG